MSGEAFMPPQTMSRAPDVKVLFSPNVGVEFTVSVVDRVGRNPQQSAVIVNNGPTNP